MKKEKKNIFQKLRIPKLLTALMLIPALLLGIFLFRFTVRVLPVDFFRIRHYADMSGEWNLILVSQDNYIPKDYEVTLATLPNLKQVDERILPYLTEMFLDAREAGIELFVREGYRSREDQKRILKNRINALREEGYSRSDARKEALRWVAVPGTSEHELGLASDINAYTAVTSNEEAYAWLKEHAYRYGFILRYPPDKTEITGIGNEPWHFRYVGLEASQVIQENGWCLEEYLDQGP